VLALAVALVTGLALMAPAIAGPSERGGQSADAAAPASGENTQRLVVLLESPAVATALGVVDGPEADAYRAQLAAERAAFADWLTSNAPQARVVWEYDTVLNGVSVDLRGTNPGLLANGPGVRQVLHPLWMSPTMSVSLPLLGWPEATGQDPTKADQTVGEGVFVGIIDTGIDAAHPFFDDSSSLFQENDTCKYSVDDPGDTRFTSCKVIVAKVFNSEDPSLTAEAVHPHGTHVAGTVAGVSGTTDQLGNDVSGVAPAALLGNYNVFPGDTPSATSDDIAVAVEVAVEDGMDVLNLSLGGTPQVKEWDVLDLALLGAADAGVIAAVAAGNSGPGEATISSPGWAPWVLTAGASTNPHFEGQTVTTSLGTTGAALGDFDPFPDGGLTTTYVWWDEIDGRGNGEACENRPLQGVDLTGEIALIKRGSCTFTTKIRNAESLGAVGVIIFNNVAGDPVAMGHDGTDPFPAIPAVMVSKPYGEQMAALDDKTVTAGGPISEQEGTADIMAGFSSRGPADTPDGLLIKPDMVAPGVNVNSSIVGGGWAFFQGTSMATPHLAGAAAAVIWARDWQDPQPFGGSTGTLPFGFAPGDVDELVKSILVNTALDRLVTDHVTGTELVTVLDEGAGRLFLPTAFGATFTADPVSISIGQVRGTSPASGSTQLSEPDASIVEVVFSVDDSVATASAEIIDGALTVTITKVANGPIGDVEGYVVVTDGTSTIRIPFWARY
jgi:subtilisin family serine protease